MRSKITVRNISNLPVKPEFYLDGPGGRANFVIERIEILQEISFGDECRFKTHSPIYIKTIRKENDTLREIDFIQPSQSSMKTSTRI